MFQDRGKLKGTQITIVENLTSKRVAILSKARNKFGVRNVWSLDGRIFAVVEGVKTRIVSIEQIDRLGVYYSLNIRTKAVITLLRSGSALLAGLRTGFGAIALVM